MAHTKPRLLDSHHKRDLPETPIVPMITQNKAHRAPTIDKQKKPLLFFFLSLFPPDFLLFTAESLAMTTTLLPVILEANLKRPPLLDILTRFSLTNGFSEAYAGFAGIDSRKVHRLEANWLDSSFVSSCSLVILVLEGRGFMNSDGSPVKRIWLGKLAYIWAIE